MGPCLFRHGNAFGEKGSRVGRGAASMGPCLFRHGNVVKIQNGMIYQIRFNGAVPFQARKFIH